MLEELGHEKSYCTKPEAGQMKIPVVASSMAGGKLHIPTMLLEPS